MSTIDADEVRRVAGLARIALTDEEIQKFAAELDVITQAVAKVNEVAKPDIPATSHPIPLTNVWREDVVGECLDHDEVLQTAPQPDRGMFDVPKIIGEE